MSKPKIGIVSTWNAICGVSEFSYFLVSALEKKGYDVVVIANKFASDLQPIVCREDGQNVFRLFGTGFDSTPNQQQCFPTAEIAEVLERNDISVLIVNFQDFVFPNKPALNALVQQFNTGPGHKSFCITHDTCFSPSMNFGLYAACIMPDKSFGTYPPNAARIVFINQGIPEIDGLDFDIQQFRKDKLLPSHEDAGYLLGCFGLGRNKTKDLMTVISYINTYKLTDKKVHLLVNLPKVGMADEVKSWDDPTNMLYANLGYMPAEKLAQYLHVCDGVIVWYPDIAHRATSSALRFGIGSKVPVIANVSNWTKDLAGTGAWIEVRDEGADSMKNAIVELFKNYKFKRLRQERLCEVLISEIGWSKIAEQYMALF